jgi:hypothetical protein
MQQVMYTFATIGGLMPDLGILLSLFVLCFDVAMCFEILKYVLKSWFMLV